MVKRKEIKLHEIDTGADWFTLNSTPRKYASRYDHEVAGADLFVAYYPHFETDVDRWAFEMPVKNDRADRAMQIQGRTIFFEIDMCSENISILFDKIENYIKFSNGTGERFHVVFVFSGEQKELDRRAKKIIPYLIDKKRGDQFSITNHASIVADPIGEVLFTPKGELKSVLNLL